MYNYNNFLIIIIIMNDKDKIIHPKIQQKIQLQKKNEKDFSSILVMKKIDEEDKNNNSNNNQGPLFDSNNYLIVY
ncbi:MAG: hypothetical protein HPPSJP_2970 [Candidatus Hepatoplasma scabrum]|nr:MAG: hypothetical protein HPPSJP_2970 [Candidatus Hepatoplasma sp.]